MTQPAKPGDPTPPPAPARLGDDADFYGTDDLYSRDRFFSDQPPEKKEKSE